MLHSVKKQKTKTPEERKKKKQNPKDLISAAAYVLTWYF